MEWRCVVVAIAQKVGLCSLSRVDLGRCPGPMWIALQPFSDRVSSGRRTAYRASRIRLGRRHHDIRTSGESSNSPFRRPNFRTRAPLVCAVALCAAVPCGISLESRGLAGWSRAWLVELDQPLNQDHRLPHFRGQSWFCRKLARSGRGSCRCIC